MEQENLIEIGDYKTNNQNIHEETLKSALVMYNKGNYEVALKMYKDLSNYYSSPTLYLELGNCYYRLGKYNYALEYWKKTIEMDTRNSTAYSNIGNLHYKLGNVNLAIENWLQSLSICPDEPKVNLNIAIAYSDINYKGEAFKYYEKYLKYETIHGKEYELINNKIHSFKDLSTKYLKDGTNFQKTNNHKAALDCYIKAYAHYPNYSKISFNIGSLFFMDNNYEQAIKHWLKAFILDSTYPKTMLNLAISYDCLRKFDYAYCFYSRYADYNLTNESELKKISSRMRKLSLFVNKNPHLVDNHLKLAEEYYHKNDLNNAKVEYQNYILLKPKERHIYKPIIEKIDFYQYPELTIIEELTKKALKLYDEQKYAEASLYFEKACHYAEENTPEYSHLKAKFDLCVRRAK